MATIINNPPPAGEEPGSGAMGMVIGAILVILALAAAIYFGMPYLKQAPPPADQNQTIKIELPIPNTNDKPTPEPTPEPAPAPSTNP